MMYFFYVAHTHTHTHTHTPARQHDRSNFERLSEDIHNFVRESVPDRQCSIKKRALTSRVCFCRGKTDWKYMCCGTFCHYGTCQIWCTACTFCHSGTFCHYVVFAHTSACARVCMCVCVCVCVDVHLSVAARPRVCCCVLCWVYYPRLSAALNWNYVLLWVDYEATGARSSVSCVKYDYRYRDRVKMWFDCVLWMSLFNWMAGMVRWDKR